MCNMDDSTLVTYKTSIGEVQYWSRKYEEAHRESILKLPEKFLCRQRKLVKRDLRIIMNKPYSKQPPPMLTIDLTRLDFDAQSRIMPVLKCFRSVSRQARHGHRTFHSILLPVAKMGS